MFLTYLRRELSGRKKQTAIIAIGMALAIALVIIVNSFAAGVKNAQASVLESVYGVGTDITVSATPAAPGEGGGGPQEFNFDEGEGTTGDDGTTSVSTSRLEAARGTGTFDASALDTVLGLDGVKDAAVALSLNNTTFDGQMPSRDSSTDTGTDGQQSPPSGGPGGGSSFSFDATTVLGINPTGSAVGPLASVTLTDGRTLEASDEGANVAVIDSAYATTEELAVGDTVNLGGTDFEIVGVVSGADSDAATASNLYIPIDVAQTLSGEADMVSTLYVQAENSGDIAAVKAAIEAALPDTTVSTQADLADSVSGSLSSASSLVGTLGTWLSIILLAAAALLAVLFTISGVTRRTREFGTLKAIGWSNRRVVGQVAGESVVQALIGGVIGVVVGLVGVVVVNLIGVSLTGSASSGGRGGMGGGMGGTAPEGAPSGGFGGGMDTATSGTDVVLSLPFNPGIILIAVGLAVVAGLLAGAIGGARAARLSPSEALRAVA